MAVQKAIAHVGQVRPSKRRPRPRRIMGPKSRRSRREQRSGSRPKKAIHVTCSRRISTCRADRSGDLYASGSTSTRSTALRVACSGRSARFGLYPRATSTTCATTSSNPRRSVRHLEDEGLIRRSPLSSDDRAVVLTERGRDLLEANRYERSRAHPRTPPDVLRRPQEAARTDARHRGLSRLPAHRGAAPRPGRSRPPRRSRLRAEARLPAFSPRAQPRQEGLRRAAGSRTGRDRAVGAGARAAVRRRSCALSRCAHRVRRSRWLASARGHRGRDPALSRGACRRRRQVRVSVLRRGQWDGGRTRGRRQAHGASPPRRGADRMTLPPPPDRWTIELANTEREEAIAVFGFTERQARFLLQVLLHSGVFLERQYCRFAGTVHGQKSTDFIRTLVDRRLATAITTGKLHRGRMFHVHYKPLWAAIGEPDSRFRKPTATGHRRGRQHDDGALDERLVSTRYESNPNSVSTSGRLAAVRQAAVKNFTEELEECDATADAAVRMRRLTRTSGSVRGQSHVLRWETRSRRHRTTADASRCE